MKMFRLFLPAVMVLMLAAPAVAQHPPQSGGQMPDAVDEEGVRDAGPRSDVSRERREEIRKKIETVRIYRLTEELKLNPQTAGKMAAFLASVEQQRREIGRTQIATMQELREALRSGHPDEQKLKGLLDKLEKDRREMTAMRDKELNGLKKILTVEQQARYVMFQREFKRDIRRMIDQARRGGRRQRPGMRDRDGSGVEGQQMR